MAEVIEIKRESVELVPKDKAQDYVDVLNGIVYDCYINCNFWQGYRNTVAVDLAVCCDLLGLDWEETLDKLVVEKVIDPNDDDEDTYKRVERVMDYSHSFDWDYMIDPERYVNLAKDEDDRVPIRFVLS